MSPQQDRSVTVVATLLIVLSLAACAGQSPAGTDTPREPGSGDTAEAPVKQTLRFADLVNVDVRDVPLLMAFDALTAQGYVIEKTYLSSSTLITDALVRGDVDVAMANTQTVWTAIAKGAEIRTVVEATGPSNLLAAHQRIQSCRDLHGRPMGVANTSGFSPVLLTLYLERRCPGAQPRIILLPEAGARAAALLAGRVDATMLPADDLIRLQQQSSVPLHALMTHATEFPDVKIDGLHIRHAWGLANSTAVTDLLRAQLRAHRLVTAQPHLLYEEASRRLSIDVATARSIGEAHLRLGIWNLDGGLTSGNVQSTIDFLADAGALPTRLKASEVADLSYLNAVLDDIGRAPR